MGKREDILAIISDVSKDAYGHRVRLNYTAMSDEELVKTYQQFCDDAEISRRAEDKARFENINIWEDCIYDLECEHRIGRATAIRWDMEAHGITDGNVGYYCFLWEIPYTMEDEIKMVLGIVAEEQSLCDPDGADREAELDRWAQGQYND